MFARKKKANLFNETLSPEMLSRPKVAQNVNKTFFFKRENHKVVNGTSCYVSETGSRLKHNTTKFKSKSRSDLDEIDQDNYLLGIDDKNIGDKLKSKASKLKKKLLYSSRNQINEEQNDDQWLTSLKMNFSNDKLDLPDSDDKIDESNIKSTCSKPALFTKFFQKSESQPVSRKNSENEKNLSSSKLTRMSLPSKFTKNSTTNSLIEGNEKLENLFNFNWFDFVDQDLEKYVTPNSIVLWSGQKKIIDSGLLFRMNKQDIELQERWFEIYTSEISYCKSLKILDEIVLNTFKKNLKIQDFNLVLITNLKEIISLSEQMIVALNSRINNFLFIENLFDIMKEIISTEKFQKVYVDYAGEKSTQKENYDNLRKNNKKFDDLMQKLNYNPILEGKDIQIYFIAPIQRLSRYKLLTDAILNILPDDSPYVEEGKSLSNLINKILKKANRKAAETLNFSEAVKLFLLLKFQNNEIKLHQLFQNRELLYHSDLLSVKSVFMSKKEDIQNSLKRNKNYDGQIQQISIYHVILLTDLLFICKKEDSQRGSFFYKVVHKAEKSQVQLEMCEWEESNDDQSCQDNIETKLFLLIFTIFRDDSNKRGINRMLNNKYMFTCTKQEGEIWMKYFENDCPIFSLESDEDN